MKFFKFKNREEGGQFPMGYPLSAGRCYTSGKRDGFYVKLEMPTMERRWWTDPTTFDQSFADCRKIVVWRRRQPRGTTKPSWFRNEVWTPTVFMDGSTPG